MSLTPPPYDEATTKEELLFTLHHRDQPTLAFVECNSTAKRNELEAFLRAELPEYQFHTIDVAPFSVVSLLRTLNEQLPAAVRNSAPVTYAVNVHGLENSLLTNRDGQLVPTRMVLQLNLERELLFRSVPYLLILWGDAYFFRLLQREAPDLWHWVTYKFRFDDDTARHPEQLPVLTPARLPERGDIAARQTRIQELMERYDCLNLDTTSRARLFREKVNILSLLADEYVEAFAYSEAIAVYETAINLEKLLQEQLREKAREEQREAVQQQTQGEQISLQSDQTQPDNFLLGQLLFNQGSAYLRRHDFNKALDAYQQSREIQPESAHGGTYHQIGMVYAEQRLWAEALANYHLALRWKEQTNNTFALGGTYHQIGRVYEEQRQWAEALANYQLALQWYEQTGDTVKLGGTYHQIGRVYAKQRQWAEALTNYQLALQWNKQTGNIFELGITYHQIGRVYEEQRQWAEALANYQLALQWKEQTGNTFALGGTYHQIGMAYAGQRQWAEALANYELALRWNKQTGNTFELGSTYHQIGMAYAAQWQWAEALANYQLALQWHEQTGNIFELGGTYHQIGMVYAEQRQWAEALANYQLAVQWKEQTGNSFALGSTYHQIGMAYAGQRQWAEALTNYQLAVQWKEQTGNSFALGNTYTQIGMVYEEQEMLPEAREWFEKALLNLTEHDHPGQPVAAASLTRVQEKLAAAVPPN